MKSLSKQLREWASSYDFYYNSIISCGLEIDRNFYPAIEKIALELDYHGKNRMSTRLDREYKSLQQKCKVFEKLKKQGCDNEDDLAVLDYSRTRIVCAANEIAGFLDLLSCQCFAEQNAPVKPKDEWITFADAANLLGVCKGTVSRWANQGRLKDNKMNGQKRKVSKIGVLFLKQQREDMDLVKDSKELRADSMKRR